MATTIRSVISEKSKYWINKHRYYELKHFCLQYLHWKKAYETLGGYSQVQPSIEWLQTNQHSDPTQRIALSKLWYREHMEIVEHAADETDPVIGDYILRAVIEGISYDAMNARDRIPCSKEAYYNLYRKFFWVLSHTRN